MSRLGALLALGLGWLSAAGAGAQADAGAEPDAQVAAASSIALADAGDAQSQSVDAAASLPPPTARVEPAPESAAPAAPLADARVASAIEVSVQSTSQKQLAERSARAVSVIDLQNERRPSDLGQVLARTEGVSVRRSGGLGASARFSLAGLSDEQIPVFIDGVPLEIAGFPFGLVNLPVGLLSRVEVYRGVVPLRLGADALGGAVDLISDSERPGSSGVVSYQAGSFDTHRATATFRYRHKPSGFVLRGSGFFDYARNDYPIRVGITQEDGSESIGTVRKRNDAYRGGSGTLEAGFVNRSWARKLLLRYSHAELYKRIPHDLGMDVPYGKVRSRRASDGLSLRYESPTLRDVSASALLAYSGRRMALVDTSLCRFNWLGQCTRSTPPGGEIDLTPHDQRVRQYAGFARLGVSYNPSAWAKLLLSTTLSGTRRTGEDRKRDPEGDALRGRRDLLTVVTGLEHQLDAWDDRLQNILSLKSYVQRVRADQVLPVGGFVPVKYDHERFGVADGLRVTLREGLLAKASYEWATRLAAPDQLFGDGILQLSNFQLKPETSHNVNVGLFMELPPLPGGAYRASLNGFGRFSKDLVYPAGGDSRKFENVSDARALGVEAAAGWTSVRRYFQLDANLTWQDLRNVTTRGRDAMNRGDRVPNRPFFFVNLSAIATATDWLGTGSEVSLAWYGNYVHRFETGWDKGLDATRPVVPSRFVHTLESTLLMRREQRSLSLSLQLYNVNDARIYDLFGVQLPGRTVLAKLTLEV